MSSLCLGIVVELLAAIAGPAIRRYECTVRAVRSVLPHVLRTLSLDTHASVLCRHPPTPRTVEGDSAGRPSSHRWPRQRMHGTGAPDLTRMTQSWMRAGDERRAARQSVVLVRLVRHCVVELAHRDPSRSGSFVRRREGISASRRIERTKQSRGHEMLLECMEYSRTYLPPRRGSVLIFLRWCPPSLARLALSRSLAEARVFASSMARSCFPPRTGLCAAMATAARCRHDTGLPGADSPIVTQASAPLRSCERGRPLSPSTSRSSSSLSVLSSRRLRTRSREQ